MVFTQRVGVAYREPYWKPISWAPRCSTQWEYHHHGDSMEYDDSEPSGYSEREEMDWTDGVEIRQENRGVIMYAVFDEEDQVSEEFGPLNDAECVSFADGYSEAKERYNDS